MLVDRRAASLESDWEHQVSMPVRIIIHGRIERAQATALFSASIALIRCTTEQMLNAANLSGRVKLSKTGDHCALSRGPLLMLGCSRSKGRWSDEESVAARQVEAKMDEVLGWQKEASAYERDISKADLYIKGVWARDVWRSRSIPIATSRNVRESSGAALPQTMV